MRILLIMLHVLRKVENAILGIFFDFLRWNIGIFKNTFQLYFDFCNQLYVTKYHSVTED